MQLSTSTFLQAKDNFSRIQQACKIFGENNLRGVSELKNVPKCGKSPKREMGISVGNEKVQKLKCGLFDKRGGGGQIFRFFPNVNVHFKCFNLQKNK